MNDTSSTPIRRSILRERHADPLVTILLSLGLKTTTQTVIITELSAYLQRNQTKQALWEFDNINNSLYLLDYADSPVLRRNVQKAYNRGESLTTNFGALLLAWTEVACHGINRLSVGSRYIQNRRYVNA